MKLAEKKVVTTYVPNIKKGCFYELTDTLSCNVSKVKVLDISSKVASTLNLRNGKIEYLFFKDTDKYEVKELKLTYVNEEDEQTKSVKIKGDVRSIDFAKRLVDAKLDINNLELDKDKSISEKDKEFLKNLTAIPFLMTVEEYLNKLNQHVNKEV